MSIEAKLPNRAKGGVSVIVGRTSDGMVTILWSTRNWRAASTVRWTEGIRSSAAGWSLESDFMTSAGVFDGSIFLAVSTNAA